MDDSCLYIYLEFAYLLVEINLSIFILLAFLAPKLNSKKLLLLFHIKNDILLYEDVFI